MRTTISLDEDVAALIESARPGEPFRSAVNRLLRRGARAASPAVPSALPELPGRPILDVSDVPALLSALDDERRARNAASRGAYRHNLLVYATFEDAPEHGRAHEWIEARFTEGERTAALCWPVVYTFLRLITSARVFGKRAATMREGWGVVAAYLEQPAVRLVVAGSRHPAIAAELAQTPGLRSDDVPDVEIATLAFEHGLVLAWHDHGFRRFSGLRVVDPLTVDAP